ncbi:MAG: hypothetical protein M3328_10460 [Chloroflexota bacterium]|nr:hypothetical protein [Chloroflexota bacterium]
MKRRVLLSTALLVFGSLLFAAVAQADSPVEPYDYAVVTEDEAKRR